MNFTWGSKRKFAQPLPRPLSWDAILNIYLLYTVNLILWLSSLKTNAKRIHRKSIPLHLLSSPRWTYSVSSFTCLFLTVTTLIHFSLFNLISHPPHHSFSFLLISISSVILIPQPFKIVSSYCISFEQLAFNGEEFFGEWNKLCENRNIVNEVY